MTEEKELDAARNASEHREPGPTASPETAATRTPRKRRWWLRIAGGLAVLVILVIAFAPRMLSTGPGNALVLGVVSDAADVKFEKASFSVGWFGGQRFEADRVWEMHDAFEARGVRAEAKDLSAWMLLRGGDAGEIPIRTKSLTVRPAQFRPSDEPPRDEPMAGEVPRNLKASVSFTAETITVETPDQPPLITRGVEASAKLASRDDVTLSINGEVQRGDQPPGSLFGDLTIKNAFDNKGRFQPGKTQLDGTIELTDLPLAAIERAIGAQGALSAFVGDELGVARLTAQGTPEQLDASLTLASPRIAETIFEMQRRGDTLSIRSRDPLRMEILPDAVARVFQQNRDASQSLLAQATTFSLDLRNASVPFDERGQPRLGSVALDASASLAPTSVRLDDKTAASLEQTNFEITTDSLGESLKAELTSTATLGETTEPITIDLDVSDPLSGQPTATASARLPLALADAITARELRLAEAIGSRLETTLSLTPADNGRVAFTLDVTSGKLLGRLGGTADLEGETPMIDLGTKQPFRFTLSPEVTLAWYRVFVSESGEAAPPYVLVEPTTLQLRVPQAKIRFRGSGREMRLDPAASRYDFTLSSDRVRVRDAEGEGQGRVITLEQVSAESQADDPSALIPILFTLLIPERTADAKLYQDAGEEVTPGRVRLALEVRDAFDLEGRFRLEQSAIGVEAKADRVPSSVIDDAAKGGDTLLAILGPVTSASLSGTYRFDEVSRFEASIESTNATANAPVAAHPDGTITAFEDLTLQLRPTEATFRKVLGEAMPMVADAVGSTQPIAIRINGDTLRVPLADGFTPSAARIDGEFNLGTLRLRRDGWVGQAVFGVVNNVLNKINFKLPKRASSNIIDASFTPVRFSLWDGIATTEQFWLHGDDIAVGFQDSRINVDSDEIEKMSMGILGASFIAGSGGKLGPFIKADQIYTLPVGGTITNPKVDTNWLTIELAGSIISRTLDKPTFGIGGKFFDVIGNPVRNSKTKPMQLDWKVPDPVIAFREKVKGTAPDEMPQELKESDVIAEEATEGEADGKQQDAASNDEADPRDIVRDLFGGLLREAVERREENESRQGQD